jgi:outer membrane protein assembly factor BamB
MRVGGKDQVVVSSDGTVDGYDPATGKQLWSFDDVGGNVSGTPFPVGPGRFLVSATPGMHNEREKEAKRSNLLLTVEPGAGGSFTPAVAWRVSALPTFANPMTHRGVAYWVNNVGGVFAFDATTGKELFTERIGQSCWAAPLGCGDRVYFFGKNGLTTVLQSGPEFKVLAQNQLWNPDVEGKDLLGEGRHGNHGGKPDTTKPEAGAGEKKDIPSKDRPASGPPRERPETGPGGKMFADPIQYGTAAVNGSLVIRSGATVYCVRDKK